MLCGRKPRYDAVVMSDGKVVLIDIREAWEELLCNPEIAWAMIYQGDCDDGA